MTKSNILRWISLFLIILFPFMGLRAGEKEKGGDRPALAYENYISIISEKLPEIKKNRVQVNRSANSVEAAKAVEDYNLEGGFYYTSETPLSSNPSMSLDKSTGYTASLGLSKKIAETGTRISSGVNYSSTSVSAESMNLNSTYYAPSLYVQVSQPVLKNAFGTVDRYAGKDARMKLEIEKLREKENNREAINYYKKLYVSWIEYSQKLALLEENIKNAKSLYEQIEGKARKGMADNDDVQRSYVSLLEYRQQYREASAAGESLEKELGLYLDTGMYGPDNDELERLFRNALAHEYTPVSFSRTRTCAIYNLTKQNYEYTRDVAENSLLPELNIEGSVKVKSQEEAFTRSIENMNKVDYSIGVSLSYPLGNHEAESSLREAQLAVDEINHEYEVSQNTYRKTMDTLISTMSGYREIYELKTRSLASKKSLYATELRKYGQARLSLSYLVETANSISSEEMNILALKKNIIGLYIDYLDLTE